MHTWHPHEHSVDMHSNQAAPALKASSNAVIYTCPMHPEVEQDHPGTCPKCGMALEAKGGVVSDEDQELKDMWRRFLGSALLTVPLFIYSMSDLVPRIGLHNLFSLGTAAWIQFIMATPVVLWGAWPFFERGFRSLVSRHLNMFTLIALGVGVAYAYSVIATIFPGLFPESLRIKCV